ncbi:MAG TPA: beta-ketoacyl synthase N-terminal-like domain-containing protein, partial [Microthrixaceae bacterium]|nr:beta-ketoacyl synthase N-terminal-like domain-containing protein [Microthrixaceae bacterium]
MSEQTGEPGVVRVAVSGVGVVSALGPTAVEFRDALFSGRHGIGPIDAIDVSHFDARVGGQVRDEWFLDRLDDWERCELGRDAQLAVASAAEAIAASGLVGAGYDPARIAVVVGRCQGDVGRLERGRPLQAAADAIARRLAAGGPRVVIATACAASTNAIGLGLDLVQSGDVDVAIVGGADDLRQSTYAGFASLQSLSSIRCEPYGRS